MPDQLSRVRVDIPKWMPLFYTVVTIGLIPWIVILSASLPARHLSRHWDLAWIGFDMAMLATVLLTAYLAVKHSGWVILSSMAVFTMLVVDAWFDILTSRPGTKTVEAILLAVLVELPLATISIWLARRVANELITTKKP